MSNSIWKCMAILPVLSVLMIPPSHFIQPAAQRHLASIIAEKVNLFSRQEALVSKEEKDALAPKAEMDLEKLKKEHEEIKLKLTEKKEIKDKEELKPLVLELIVHEKNLEDLKGKKVLSVEEEKDSIQALRENKLLMEKLLTDLEPAKEEVKLETATLEKKEELTPKKEVCTAEEENKLLTDKVQSLVTDQQLIIQTMVTLTQMMVMMMQQQQNQQSLNPYYSGPIVPYNYMYQYAPVGQGNWVYYPSGSGPQSNNPQSGQNTYPDLIQTPPVSTQGQTEILAPIPQILPAPIPGEFGDESRSPALEKNEPMVTLQQ